MSICYFSTSGKSQIAIIIITDIKRIKTPIILLLIKYSKIPKPVIIIAVRAVTNNFMVNGIFKNFENYYYNQVL